MKKRQFTSCPSLWGPCSSSMDNIRIALTCRIIHFLLETHTHTMMMMHGAVTRFAAAFPVHLPMLSQCREGIEMTGGLAICGRIAGDGSDRNRQTKKNVVIRFVCYCVCSYIFVINWILICFCFVFFFSFSSTTAIFYHPAGACLARYGRTGLFFHVVGEGVVRLLKNGRQHISDRENYIDFRMRLLGEPGNAQHILHFFFFFLRPVSPSVNHTRRWAAPPVERRRRFYCQH